MSDQIKVLNNREDFSNWEWGECDELSAFIDAISRNAATLVLAEIANTANLYLSTDSNQSRVEFWCFDAEFGVAAPFQSMVDAYIDDQLGNEPPEDKTKLQALIDELEQAASKLRNFL